MHFLLFIPKPQVLFVPVWLKSLQQLLNQRKETTVKLVQAQGEENQAPSNKVFLHSISWIQKKSSVQKLMHWQNNFSAIWFCWADAKFNGTLCTFFFLDLTWSYLMSILFLTFSPPHFVKWCNWISLSQLEIIKMHFEPDCYLIGNWHNLGLQHAEN